MKTIPLTQGKVALVDNDDFGVLSDVKWFAAKRGRTFYAERSLPRCDGRRRLEHMHRVVLERKLGRPISPGMDPDHDDGDGLNNQRENLFEVTHRGNAENLHVVKTSQYLGVSWDKRDKKWVAHIMDGKDLNLGYYDTELAAALARERYVAAHPELGARSNFEKGVS